MCFCRTHTCFQPLLDQSISIAVHCVDVIMPEYGDENMQISAVACRVGESAGESDTKGVADPPPSDTVHGESASTSVSGPAKPSREYRPRKGSVPHQILCQFCSGVPFDTGTLSIRVSGGGTGPLRALVKRGLVVAEEGGMWHVSTAGCALVALMAREERQAMAESLAKAQARLDRQRQREEREGEREERREERERLRSRRDQIRALLSLPSNPTPSASALASGCPYTVVCVVDTLERAGAADSGGTHFVHRLRALGGPRSLVVSMRLSCGDVCYVAVPPDWRQREEERERQIAALAEGVPGLEHHLSLSSGPMASERLLRAAVARGNVLDCVVERKTAQDLVNSLFNGHLARQAQEMGDRGFSRRLLVCEGVSATLNPIAHPKHPINGVTCLSMAGALQPPLTVVPTPHIDATLALYHALSLSLSLSPPSTLDRCLGMASRGVSSVGSVWEECLARHNLASVCDVLPVPSAVSAHVERRGSLSAQQREREDTARPDVAVALAICGHRDDAVSSDSEGVVDIEGDVDTHPVAMGIGGYRGRERGQKREASTRASVPPSLGVSRDAPQTNPKHTTRSRGSGGTRGDMARHGPSPALQHECMLRRPLLRRQVRPTLQVSSTLNTPVQGPKVLPTSTPGNTPTITPRSRPPTPPSRETTPMERTSVVSGEQRRRVSRVVTPISDPPRLPARPPLTLPVSPLDSRLLRRVPHRGRASPIARGRVSPGQRLSTDRDRDRGMGSVPVSSTPVMGARSSITKPDTVTVTPSEQRPSRPRPPPAKRRHRRLPPRLDDTGRLG
ncbi:hypothetical protein KIPB_003060 [Kipferlia bialata]|uniref:ERCC4 domain-containing protein n=1 Tax=Kipferlia bialata TaxID=797122 RepID=A0A9K3CRK1_9EUKA|nr:hypothetical protein KIPB_003060 [Kipferlia bialata]|eukprot:g3060.t1